MIATLKRTSISILACAAMALMASSCTKDSDSRPANEQVAAIYNGTTTVKVNGVNPGLAPAEAQIKIEKSGDKAKLTLVKSDYGDMLQGAVISVDGISVAGDKKKYTLSGSGHVTISGKQVPVTISGGGPMAQMVININVAMTAQMSVEVIFTAYSYVTLWD